MSVFYLRNKLHNATVRIKDPDNERYLGACHSEISCGGGDEKIWLVKHAKDFESFTILCLPGVHDEILVNISTHHKQLLLSENNTLLTKDDNAETREIPTAQWKLILVSKETKRSKNTVWFNFHIQHIASNQFLHLPPEAIFPNSNLSLSNEPCVWAIGVTRFFRILTSLE